MSFIITVCFVASGCVGPAGFQDPAQRAAALAAFHAGTATLSCPPGKICALQWANDLPAAARLGQAQRWDDVAEVVLAANEDQDLAWLYLGMAAAGLGDQYAARVYLQRAEQRSLIGGAQTCQPNCNGVDVGATAQNILALLAQQQQQQQQTAVAPPPRRAAVRRVRPTGEAAVTRTTGAAAEGETWVAPVPSTP